MTNNITHVLRNTIPISLFNKGLAGKIFDEVKKTGAKVVFKNNTPECVLISPDEYIRMIDAINDAKLLELASARMENFDPKTLKDANEVYSELNISQKTLDEMDDVEIE